MNGEIQMHDMVVLLEDTAASHFETGRPMILRRGQVGTVVMIYEGNAFEVEFAGRDGRAARDAAVEGGRTDGVAGHARMGHGRFLSGQIIKKKTL